MGACVSECTCIVQYVCGCVCGCVGVCGALINRYPLILTV